MSNEVILQTIKDNDVVSDRIRAEEAARISKTGNGVNPKYVSLVVDQDPIDYVDGSGVPFGEKPITGDLIQRLYWDPDNPGLGWQDLGVPIPDKKYIDANASLSGRETILDLIAININTLKDGNNVYLSGYYSKGDGGGGGFYWDANKNKSEHNGGTIINPEHLSTIGSSNWYSSTGDATDDTGTGCWVRDLQSEVTAKMFGTVNDGVNDDAVQIQKAFDYWASINGKKTLNLGGYDYTVEQTINYPKFINANNEPVHVKAYGARFETSSAITIIERIASEHNEAKQMIEDHILVWEGGVFQGNNAVNSIGINFSASYTTCFSNIHIANCERGFVGTFMLLGSLKHARFTNCLKKAVVIRSAGHNGEDGSLVWSGASITNSASNMFTMESVRAYTPSGHFSSFCIYGSDMVEMHNCISEGHGDNFDVYFDYQGSTGVSNFLINNFWCEAPNQKLNFKIKAKGVAKILNPQRIYPAAFLDYSGSAGGVLFVIDGNFYWGNPPTGTDPDNPNARFFFGSNGYGATTEGGKAGTGGKQISFINMPANSLPTIKNPAYWEGGELPYNLFVENFDGANGGLRRYSTGMQIIEGGLYATEQLGFVEDGVHDIGSMSAGGRFRPKRIFASESIRLEGNQECHGWYRYGEFGGYDFTDILAGETKTFSYSTPVEDGINRQDHCAIIQDKLDSIPDGVIMNSKVQTNTVVIKLTNITASTITVGSVDFIINVMFLKRYT